MSDTVVELNRKLFEELMKDADKNVLIDVWAEWCPPCRAMSPIVDSVAEKYRGRLTVAKLDAESDRELAAELKVQALPTLKLFVGGKETASRIGATSEAELTAWIEESLEI